MADRLDVKPDHVAVAVPDQTAAARRWVEQLGGAWMLPVGFHNGIFRARQVRWSNGAKLELVQPSEEDPSPDNFLRQYLDRFGSGIHHITLKLSELLPAVEIVRGHGYDVVDVNTEDDSWHEAFLRPSQVGGVVVQLARPKHTDEEIAELRGTTLGQPRDDAPALLGPVLQHPDLAAARDLWTVLGAEVVEEGGELVCHWPDAPLRVFLREGERAGPLHLRMSGAPALPPDPDLGAAVEPVSGLPWP